MGRLLLKLLLNSLIFINARAFFFSSFFKNDLPNGYRLPDYVIPQHYNIKLEPYFEVEGKSFIFSGRCEAYVQIINPTWYLSLHAQKPQIEIQNTTVINTESLDLYNPTNTTYNNETHILIFTFDYELSNGHYLLNMSFIGLSDNDGNFFRAPYINYNRNKMWFVATQFGVIGARQLFPCWDEPAFKATFNITVRHHITYLSLSSMPTQNITLEYENNKVWTRFRTTRLMSTYLVSLVLHDIHSLWFHNGDARYEPLLLQDVMFAKNLTHNVTMRFRNEWKYSENLSYVHHLITRGGPQHNGMGLILYRVSNVFYNEILDPVSHKIKAACIVAYEVARQWFNNLISPSWWSDYWLNEGIARLLGMDIVNKIFQDSRMLNLFAVQSKQESLHLDHFLSGIMNPLISKVNKSSEIDSLFSFSYYIKAPVILRMLQQLLTDKVFQQGIEIFLSKHKFSSATIDDFWSAMQVAQNVSEIPNIKKFDVKEIMNTWTKQKHYPVLKVTQSESNDSKYLRISIENVYSLAKDDWFIPITIITIRQKPDFKVVHYTWQYYWKAQLDHIDNPSVEFDISREDELIIVNLQQGYYRVNYEPENWRNIARYLNSANYMNIHVLNRAQIIDDAFYFFSMLQLNLSTFLELTEYLSQETDYVAWYPMIKALENMSSIFPILDKSVDLFKKNMLEILNGVLEHIGYEERSEEDYLTKCLRQEVAKWACTLEHSKCLQMAKYKLKQHLNHHEKLLPWWKEWTYCKGIMTEKNLTGIWKIIFEKWMSDSDNRLLEFLTCIAHPNSIKEYLDDKKLEVSISLKNISLKFRDIDRVNRFLFTIMKHAKNNEILEYILNNFEELKPREVNTVAALIIIINHVYSKTQLEKITKFVENNLRKEIITVKNVLIENMFFHNEFDKVHEYVRNLANQRISFITHKIRKRTNEIMLF